MKTYGPISAIANTDLFDEICNRIDATLSGFSTGWNIVVDARDPGRVPTASGFLPIYRQLSETQNTDITTEEATYNRKMTIQTVVKDADSGLIYMYTSGRNSSDAFLATTFKLFTSPDGVDFTGPTDINPGTGVEDAMMTISHRKMADGLFWAISPRGNGLNGSQAHVYKYSSDITPLWTSTGATFGQFPPAIDVGAVKKSSEGGFAFNWCPDNQNMHVFWPVDNTYGLLHGHLQGADFATAQTFGGTHGNVYCRHTDIGVDDIFGISRMEEFPDHYLLWMKVLYSGNIITIAVKETAKNFSAPIFDVVAYTDIWASEPAIDQITQSISLMRYDRSIESHYLVDCDPASASVIATIKTKYNANDVDGNPDYQGLQYEYVTFKSTHTENSGNGYFMTLLQLNPLQVAPPTVAGITDVKPIFMRASRNWTIAGEIIRFLFDPIIPVGVDPTTINLLAPMMVTIPRPADSPDETFKLWLRCSPEQVFIFTESSGGVDGIRSQYLHYNITTPLQSMDTASLDTVNDNVVFSGAGWPTGKETLILGRNHFPEIVNIRSNGRPNYQLGAQKSYAGVLTTVNAVDGKNYPFPIYVASNDAQTYGNAAINSFTYSPGVMRETFSYTNMASVVTDDIVPVDGINHKVFKASPANTATYPANTLDNLLIKWA